MLEGNHKEGTFVEHLEELRWALIRSVVSVLLLFPAAFACSDYLIGGLVKHFCPAELTLRYFSPVEPLMVKLKFALSVSLFLAAPYILRQVWGFVSPGLYLREKAFAGWLLVCSWVLFAAGATFALLAILPMVMKFSLEFQTPYLEAAIGFEQFIGLVTVLMLGFAVMFQFPAAVFLLIRTGMMSLQRIKSLRAYVVVGVMIVSAILTPPDVISQLMMAIPAYLLFEAGLLLASFAESVTGQKMSELEKNNLEKSAKKEENSR